MSSFGFGGTNGHVVLAATALQAEKKGPSNERVNVHLEAFSEKLAAMVARRGMELEKEVTPEDGLCER